MSKVNSRNFKYSICQTTEFPIQLEVCELLLKPLCFVLVIYYLSELCISSLISEKLDLFK